jgi:hypothetical protein
MKAKLKSLTEYDARSKKHECHWLLKNVRSVMMQFYQKRNGYLAIMDAHQGFLNCKQSQEQTTEEYLEDLTLWADTIEYHGGRFVENWKLASENDASGASRTEAERKSAARDETLAMALIRGADPTRYGTLIAELSNQFALGRNDYPTDLQAAYSLLVNYCTPTNAKPRNTSSGNQGGSQRAATAPADDSTMTFTQRSSTGDSNATNITPSAISASPPSSSNASVATGTTLMQFAVMMAQAPSNSVDPNWILLDSQSTISVFCNKDMLNNVRPSPHVLRAITNGGTRIPT